MLTELFDKITYSHVIVREDSLRNMIEEALTKATGVKYSEVTGRIDIVEHERNKYILVDKITLSQIMVEIHGRLNISFNIYPYTIEREVYVRFLKNTYKKGIVGEILEYISGRDGHVNSAQVYKKFKDRIRMKLLDDNTIELYTPYHRLRITTSSRSLEVVDIEKQFIFS